MCKLLTGRAEAVVAGEEARVLVREALLDGAAPRQLLGQDVDLVHEEEHGDQPQEPATRGGLMGGFISFTDMSLMTADFNVRLCVRA